MTLSEREMAMTYRSELITTREACAIMGIKIQSLHARHHRGYGPWPVEHNKGRGGDLYDKAEIERWAANKGKRGVKHGTHRD